jgi:glutamyl-tRNA synthetase
MSNRPVRVRYAPSPTGPQHLGGVRTALYNYLFAKKVGGTFIIRIEDTDQTRFVEGAEQYMLDSLEWCGIEYQEGPNKGGDYGPYKQSERKHLYRQYADQLTASGHAYYAFDTPEELDEMREKFKASGMAAAAYGAHTREYMKNSLVLPGDEVAERIAKNEPYVIRIKMPRKEEIKLNDLIRGWVTFHSSTLDDKVLFKSDGMPTYHLANVVDDYLMKITHVIRGEEWLPSAPLHVMLYKYLGWEEVMPDFAHLPLILRPDGNGKLSKRDGDRLGFPVFPLNWKDPATGEQSLGFKERGFFKEPFVNMIALLGWHPGGIQQEVFTMEELIQHFTIEHIGKSGARFDYEKAKWFNQEYIKKLDDKTLAQSFKKLLTDNKIENNLSDTSLEMICHSLKERCTFVNELLEQSAYFFKIPDSYDDSIVSKKWNATSKPVFEKLKVALSIMSDFSSQAVHDRIMNFIKENNLQNGDVLPLLRIILSGTKNGPAVYEIAAILGKEKTIERMEIFFNKFVL